MALWLLVSRRRDVSEHRREEPVAASKPRFADKRLWSFMLAYALGALPLAFVIYGSAIYLSQVRGASQALIGKLLWIPPLGWEIGYFFWGWLSDRLPRSEGEKLGVLRRLLTATTVLSLPLALLPWTPTLPLVMFHMFLAMFAAGGFIILTVSYATHVYSMANSGLIAGLGAGAWSAAVAVAMPLLGRLIDRHRWDVAFLLAAVLPAVGYLFWLAANRRGRVILRTVT
jgi:MFS transporter, ACS family, hexuronate transporter